MRWNMPRGRVVRVLLLLLLGVVDVVAQSRKSFTICQLINGYCGASCAARWRPLKFPIDGFLCPRADQCCVPVISSVSSKTTPRPTSRPNTPFWPTRTTTRSPPTPSPTTPRTELNPSCGSALTPKIYGGSDAQECEFPWMVYLFRDQSPCGASIIDSRHLVTAAHCVHKVSQSHLKIVIGEHRRSKWLPASEFELNDYRIFVHPKYNPKYYTNDIAIIKLNTDIPWGNFKCLRPICLPETWRRFRSVTCTVTGWGVVSPIINFLQPPLADVLQKVNVDIVSDKVCTRSYSKDWFRPTNYCAGYLGGGRDSCQGDSGGPLQCRVNGRWVLAGLVSTGSGCGERGKAAIYTDVAKYISFIEQIRRIY